MEEVAVDSQEVSRTSSEHQWPMLMPSRIGREFVRQYYCLLQKAPEYLHRFYTNDSTCTHGNFDLALGRRDIKSLFRRKNYTDCTTIVLQFHVHGTLCNGVVVLVTGEQSNAGFPMRPFVQTFVLASEGPRRYYVYNDIFRYTDTSAKLAKSVTDVECQTSIEHIGDGDQQYYFLQLGQPQQQAQQQQLQPQQQQQQQPQKKQQQLQAQEFESQEIKDFRGDNDIFLNLSSVENGAPCNIDTNSARINLSETCSIPMPRWANSVQHNSSKHMNNYSQLDQMDELTYHCDNQIHDSNSNTIDGYTRQEQDRPECAFYRSLNAQALTSGIQFEDFTPLSSNGYGEITCYNENISRASIGVNSCQLIKRCSDNMLGMPTQQQNGNKRDSKEFLSYNHQQMDDSQTQSIEGQEKMPTYAKLLMSAFTRASLKNNQAHKIPMNNSTIASPLRATNNMYTYNNSNSNNNNNNNINNNNNKNINNERNEDMSNASSSSSPASTITDHQEQSFPTPPTQGFFPIQRNNYSHGIRRNDRRRASSAQKYDDNQQLFLGQIPHNATEEELISIFSCFGNVLELRILPNLGGKIQSGAKHPLKYGFLTFERVESVKTCLESRPVFFPNNSPNGQKLNVRAKKPSVSRDEPACQPLDGQSLGNDWLKTSTRRNNSVGHSIVDNSGGNGSSTIYNRKDNRHNRGASLDSGTQIQGSKKFVPSTGTSSPGSCRRR